MEIVYKKKAVIQPVNVFYLNQAPEKILPAVISKNKNLTLQAFSNGLDLYQYLKSGHVPEVLLVNFNHDSLAFIRLLQQDPPLKKTPVILISSEVNAELLDQASILGIDDVFPTADLNHHFLARLQYLIKKYRLLNNRPEVSSLQEAIHTDLERLADVFFSVLILFLTAPFLALVASLIKISSKGPVFESTNRIGSSNKIFEYYKFRTTLAPKSFLVGEEPELNDTKLPREDSQLLNSGFFIWFGQWLAHNKLDELPKLFNILRGDIQVAGTPQPLYRSLNFNPEEYRLRFAAPSYLNQTSLAVLNAKNIEVIAIPAERAKLLGQEKNLWLNLKLILKSLPASIYKRKNILSPANHTSKEHQVVYS
jgi:lipopolysaccharide/colanic/teichoic acid biosynthesis glycosyltransferase